MRKLTIIIALFGIVIILIYVIQFRFFVARNNSYNNDLIKIQSGVYASTKFNTSEVKKLSAYINEALARNKKFWGRLPKDLNLIICFDMSECKRFSGLKNCGTSTQFLPWGTYITIGPRGWNPDVISHEICHSILEEEIGYFSIRSIPTWLNEGIAMQVDYRKEFDYQVLEENKKADAEKLSEISTIKGFYATNSDELRQNYAISKYMVRSMFEKSGGKEDFLKHLTDLQ